MFITLADKRYGRFCFFADTRLLRANAHHFCQGSGITNSIFNMPLINAELFVFPRVFLYRYQF